MYGLQISLPRVGRFDNDLEKIIAESPHDSPIHICISYTLFYAPNTETQ